MTMVLDKQIQKAVLPKHIREAIYHYIPKMVGMTSAERCCEMAELIIRTKSAIVVDIGIFGGVTTVAQAFALRENGRGMIYGIDAWDTATAVEGESLANSDWWHKINMRDMYTRAVHAVFDHRLMDWAIVLRARSQDVAHLFDNIDILNIDGCHSEIASCRDVDNYLPRVRRGGYVWFDDTDWPTTSEAQGMLETVCDTIKVGNDGHYKLYRKR